MKAAVFGLIFAFFYMPATGIAGEPDDTPFSPSFREALIRACVKRGTAEAVCTCAINRVAKEVKIDELIVAMLESKNGSLPPEMKETIARGALQCAIDAAAANKQDEAAAGDGKYPQKIRDSIFKGCMKSKSASAERCNCVTDEVEKQIPLGETLVEMVKSHENHEFCKEFKIKMTVVGATCLLREADSAKNRSRPSTPKSFGMPSIRGV